MNACSERCGWCGMCTDDIRDYPEPQAYPFCDECGAQIYQGELTLAGVGMACCRDHLDRLAAKHEARMNRRTA